MGILKKTAAVQIEKLSVIKDITITEEEVKFSIQYSSSTIKLEEVPKVLADIMQLYVCVKPILDKKQAKNLKDKASDLEEDSKEIDLSTIPF